MIKRSAWVLLLSLVFQSTALALGPMETKRERAKRESRDRQQFSRSNVNLILNSNPKTQTVTEKIYENFLKENYVTAESLASTYLKTHSGFREADEIAYLQALCLFKLQRVQEARVKLKALAESSRQDSIRSGACVSLGDSYADERKTDLALLWYEEAVKKFPHTDEASYAQDQIVRLGAARQKAVNSGQAIGGYFSVQVGSFSKESNAKAVVKKLIAQHYDAYVEKDPSKRLFRVRVGRLTQEAEVKVLEMALKQEGYSTRICP